MPTTAYMEQEEEDATRECGFCGYVSMNDEIGQPGTPKEIAKDRCPQCGRRFRDRRQRSNL